MSRKTETPLDGGDVPGRQRTYEPEVRSVERRRTKAAARPAAPIVQQDDGGWQIGLGDDPPGPFRTRREAEAIAATLH